jgi:CRP-like cAMP-binding protein
LKLVHDGPTELGLPAINGELMDDIASVCHLMRQMPVFAGLSDAALTMIVEESESVTVPAGEYFFREGDSANSFFVLKSGTVLIERDWEGTPVKLARLGIGDCFGEMAIIDLMNRSASTRAESDCEAIEITRTTLSKLYQQDLEQYAIVMMNMGREVSRRLRSASERLFAIDQTMPR